uniref:Gypsy retrotransposon integrase-like protein 1 n=1 Tax=Pelodiscus sinensis TaxID=13735 RepID=K7EYA7_PELSI
MAYRGLPAREALHYYKVKEAILDQVGITPETYRQRFRQERYRPGDRPRAVAHRLKESGMRWLEPEPKTGMQVAEIVILEQFIQVLPGEGQRWVRRHRPSTLAEAVTLMEDFVAAEGTEERGKNPVSGPPGRASIASKGPAGRGERRQSAEPGPVWGRKLAPVWRNPAEEPRAEKRGPAPEGDNGRKVGPPNKLVCFQCGQEGHFRRECPVMDCTFGRVMTSEAQKAKPLPSKVMARVKVGGRIVEALVDSGCGQTMVRADLVEGGAATGGPIWMQCVHGDVRPYPTAWVQIEDGRHTETWRVALAPNLAYPALLGYDWPGLGPLLRQWGQAVTSPEDDPGERVPEVAQGEEAQAPTSGHPTGGATPAGTGEDTQLSNLEVDEGDFIQLQREDPSLQRAWDQATAPGEGDGTQETYGQNPRFEVRVDRLYRVTLEREGRETVRQLLVPTRYRWRVLELAHAHPWAGHLGREKTQQRVLQRFFWPGVYRAVRDFCDSCPQCQLTAPAGIPRAPLIPLPVVGVPFERVAFDLVGPVEKSGRGHQFILVLIDYATRYPEAVPLRSTTASVIAGELVKIFARVGLPREVLTDQGPNVTSRVMSELCRMLRIKTLRTSVYHPQTDGLVERFNKTLKAMIRRFIHDDPREWDKMLPALLFAVREVPQASSGYSPFELLYGRQPRGILDLVKENWEEQESRARGTVHYVLQLRERLRALGELAKSNLERAQEHQERRYNQGARLREFAPGDRVLLLLPDRDSKLMARWQGPFEVLRRVGKVDYELRLQGKRKDTQIYHVNLLKRWKPREALLVDPRPLELDLGPWCEPEEKPWIEGELAPAQRKEMEQLLQTFPHVLTSHPGKTTLAAHEIDTEPGKRVRNPLRPLPRKLWEPVKQELQLMLQWGVVEESHSDWRSPIVLVPKADKTLRFCIDFRGVNAISRFDAYPMPRVEELLERIGEAQYLSTIDLTKGYWQIPLTPGAREKTAFATPFGLYQFVTMPFGLHGAAATFQRLMDRILRQHQAFAVAYIDDIVIFSTTWEQHLKHVQAILKTLAEAGLTANPKKCKFGRREVSYLGYTVGGGRLKPLVDKVSAVRDWPLPTTKRQIRQFLGLAGYYRRFIADFATLAAPLTDMTRNNQPQKVRWTERGRQAFDTIKRRLVSAPILRQPDFSRPFILQTDASEVGLGAVLAQEVEGGEHPILYLSRKLFDREKNYATIEKEALAVKWAIEALRYYLLGDRFLLITDHAPLKWIQSMKETNARIMRWYLALQPYCFQVVHRPGAAHQNADFLSRSIKEAEGTKGPPELDLRGEVCDGVRQPRTGRAPPSEAGESGAACLAAAEDASGGVTGTRRSAGGRAGGTPSNTGEGGDGVRHP